MIICNFYSKTVNNRSYFEDDGFISYFYNAFERNFYITSIQNVALILIKVFWER